jgi:hypothetical protein
MHKSRLTWIKSRARCIQRFYKVSRRVALIEARVDMALFLGADRLQMVQGGAR